MTPELLQASRALGPGRVLRAAARSVLRSGPVWETSRPQHPPPTKGADRPETARPQSTEPAAACPEDPIGELRSELVRLGKSRRHVVAGPMFGSMAFELLFWLPMLRWATSGETGLRERLTAISRGGASSWYGDLRCVELEELYDVPAGLVLRNALVPAPARPDNPLESPDLHHDAVEHVRVREGLGDLEILHCSLLYRAYRAASGPGEIERLRELAVPGAPVLPPPEFELPSDFVLVNAQLGASLPDEATGREALSSLAAGALEQAPLVIFGGRWLAHQLTGSAFSQSQSSDSHPIVVLEDLAPEEPPLRLVSAALTAARSFLGPYDGMTYLAALSGTPSVAPFADRRTVDRRQVAYLRQTTRDLGAVAPDFGNVGEGLSRELRDRWVRVLARASEAGSTRA